MCNIKIRGITIEQMDQLIEMTKFFYEKKKETHVFQDPDFQDNIVISSERGDDYNTVGWFQVCFDLILPKIVDIEQFRLFTGLVDTNDLFHSFVNECIINHHHPINLLYPPFLAIKSEKEDATNRAREEAANEDKTSEA